MVIYASPRKLLCTPSSLSAFSAIERLTCKVGLGNTTWRISCSDIPPDVSRSVTGWGRPPTLVTPFSGFLFELLSWCEEPSLEKVLRNNSGKWIFLYLLKGCSWRACLFPRVLSPGYHKDLFSCVHFRERLGVMRSGTVFAFWTLRWVNWWWFFWFCR